MRERVLIVGGGLAGLACAGALEARGVPFRLFEASDRVGGRVRTDVVDGLRLDRGFQVHFPAYPNAARALGDADLDLRAWRSGAHVWDGGRLRTLDRDRPLHTLFQGVLALPDLLRLLLLSVQTTRMSVEAIRGLADRTAEAELRARGFTEKALRRFLRPFYGGVFLDAALGVSRRQFLFVAKMLAEGPAAVPNGGIEALPRALADRFPSERVETQAAVDELLMAEGRVAGLRVGGESVEASQIVLATDADTTARLTGLPLARGWRSSACLYFESERPISEGPYLVLNGSGRGRVNEVAPLTNVAPGYAPPGRHLLSATVLGSPSEPDAALEDEVCRELRTWFPGAGELRFVRTYRVREGQLPQPPGFDAPLPPMAPGLILAGELATDSSIDGAIASGLRAAEAVQA